MSIVYTIGWWNNNHSKSGDMEDGITFNDPSFCSLLFSLFLYIVASWPGTNGVSTSFKHLQRELK